MFNFSVSKVVIALIMIVLLFVVVNVIRTRHYINIGKVIASKAKAYEQSPDNPTATVLVMGDSSAVGTGAEDSSKSVAGLLGAEHSRVRIINKAVNGLRTDELVAQLPKVEGKVDLIIIHIGGNDIVHFTPLKEVEKNLMSIVEMAKTKADKVVVLHGGNVGTSKLFPFGSRWIFTMRTKQVRQIYLKVSAQMGINYVDMFREVPQDPFYIDPEKYYSNDYFHPSADGYKLWYSQIAPFVSL